MVAKLEKTQDGYAIRLTAEMVEALHVAEGAEVEVRPVREAAGEQDSRIRYASTEEVLAAFERTLPQHENTYRELAK